MDPGELILIVHGGAQRQELDKGFERAAIPNRLWVCRDGLAAFAYLTGAGVHRDRKQFPMPAVVIVDLELPQEDAFTLLKWSQSQKFVLRTVMVGVGPWERHANIQNAFDLGMNSYYRMPTELDDLVDFIRALEFVAPHEAGQREGYVALDLVASPHSQPSAPAEMPWHVCLYLPRRDLAANSTARTLERVFTKTFPGLRHTEFIRHREPPLDFSQDEVFAIPTFIRKSPPPKRKIIGNFDEPDRLILSLDLPFAAS